MKHPVQLPARKPEKPAGIWHILVTGLATATLALLAAAPVVLAANPWPDVARNLLVGRGTTETGAGNLVSAIYLGYRAYDTVGETIVLFVALSGAVALIAGAARGPSPVTHGGTESGDMTARPGHPGQDPQPAATPHPARLPRQGRTEILDVVAGKLAPIVILFGTYVMLYGHVSPGGGFQGGVVLASGIVFLAIGRNHGGIGRMEPALRFFDPSSLARVEVLAFTAILLLSFPGITSPIGSAAAWALPDAPSIPPIFYIIALNMAIGLKVGSGVALLCLLMLGEEAP